MSGLLYARPAGTRDQPVAGEDEQDLADQITRAERLAVAEESPGKCLSADVPAAELARLIAVGSASNRPGHRAGPSQAPVPALVDPAR